MPEPASIQSLNGLIEQCYRDGCLNEAREHARLAVRAAPHDTEILNNAGIVAAACGERAEAEVLFKRALVIDPHFSNAHFNLCDLWGKVCTMFAPDPNRKSALISSLRWISRNAPDPARTSLMRENHRLRGELLARYKDCLAHHDRRVLLHRPASGWLKYLMDNWRQVLTFMGIETFVLERGKRMAAAFEAARPNVFITVADPGLAGTLDNDFIANYRREIGLSIGRITTFEHEVGPADFLIALKPDPIRNVSGSNGEIPVVSLSFGVNPLIHCMRPGREIWDYFFVGTNSPRKSRSTRDYLVPIIQRWSGILAGGGWNVGVGELTVEQAAEFYNFARVYPNYSVPRDKDTATGVNGRTFIIPACGGFELMDNAASVRELFADDELAVAETPDQYHDMFEYYRVRPDDRRRIALNGMRRVYRDYTLFPVMSKLMEFLGFERRVPADAASTDLSNSSAEGTSVRP